MATIVIDEDGTIVETDENKTVGENALPIKPEWERIGNPSKGEGPVEARFSLTTISLERKEGNGWVEEKRELFGVWANMPASPADPSGEGVAQSKLLLLARNPFEHSRQSGGLWDEAFVPQYPAYPNMPPVKTRQICWTFEYLSPNSAIRSPIQSPDESELSLGWLAPIPHAVDVLEMPVAGFTHMLCFPSVRPSDNNPTNCIIINLPDFVRSVRIIAIEAEGVVAKGFRSVESDPNVACSRAAHDNLEVKASGEYWEITYYKKDDTIKQIVLQAKHEICLLAICVEYIANPDMDDERSQVDNRATKAAKHWEGKRPILRHNTIYRLKLETTVEAKGYGELAGWSPPSINFVEYAFFRTEGPPGLANLSLPIGMQAGDEVVLKDSGGNYVKVDGESKSSTPVLDSNLNDLTLYVTKSYPPSIPGTGEQPTLPVAIYRGYDLFVEFVPEINIAKMYEDAGRRLILYLFDSNDRPLRDMNGYLIQEANRWDVQEALTLTAEDARWITIRNAHPVQDENGKSSNIDEAAILHSEILRSVGHLLAPDTIYEARLLPLDGLITEKRLTTTRAIYRFKFRTSRFVNFFHHVHSYQDETWVEKSASEIDPAKSITLDNLGKPVSVEERQAYENLAEKILGAAAMQNPTNIEITRIIETNSNGESVTSAFLVRSPEPIDWQRASLELLYAKRWSRNPEIPQDVKIVSVNFAQETDGTANDESVELLLRENTDLSGYGIERYRLPGPLDPLFAPDEATEVLFEDNFEHWKAGLLFEAQFNSMGRYEIVDEGTIGSPSRWEINPQHTNNRLAKGIIQTRRVHDADEEHNGLNMPGTMAVVGEDSWSNVRIAASLRNDNPHYGTVGIVFRYLNRENYYRISIGNEIRLMKKIDGKFLLLPIYDVPYVNDQEHNLIILVHDDTLIGYLNKMLLFSVKDSDIGNGRVGFYCWDTDQAYFTALSVESLEVQPILWNPQFVDLADVSLIPSRDSTVRPSEFSILDIIEDMTDVPSLLEDLDFRTDLAADRISPDTSLTTKAWGWSADDGILRHIGDSTTKPSSYIIGGHTDWRDIRISTKLRAEGSDAVGLLFRYQDNENFYIFAIDQLGAWLTKKANNTFIELWSDNSPSSLGQYHHVTLRAVGSVINLYLDGGIIDEEIFDDSLPSGRVGFYCSSVMNATFENVLVTNEARRFGPWVIGDKPGIYQTPPRIDSEEEIPAKDYFAYQRSIWFIADEKLVARAETPAFAIVGDLGWTDYRVTVTLDPYPRINGLDDYTRYRWLQSADFPINIFEQYGVYFRYQDPENYYLLILDNQYEPLMGPRIVNYKPWRTLELIKVENRVKELLLSVGPEFGMHFFRNVGAILPMGTLTLDVIGSHITAKLNDKLLLDLSDDTYGNGQIGIWGWVQLVNSTVMRIDGVKVSRLRRFLLFRDRFAEGSGAFKEDWSPPVEEGNQGGPSNWHVDGNTLYQTRNIHDLPNDARDPLNKLGTQIIAGDLIWTDIVFRVYLESHDDDAIGVIFRYKGPNNYYRFSMDLERNYWRLVKKADGAFIETPLWEADFSQQDKAFKAGHRYELILVAIGNNLCGFINGVSIFELEDDDAIESGQIGLYCWGNTDARFSNVFVYTPEVLFDNWLFSDSFGHLISDRWEFVDAEMGSTPLGSLIPSIPSPNMVGHSNWEVSKSDHELRQTAIYPAIPGIMSNDKLGTFALTGSPEWTDYRVVVRLSSHDDGAIGVIFRYIDKNNYYRFSMETGSDKGNRKLIKMKDGKLLHFENSEDSHNFRKGRDYIITIDCLGARILVYVDGILVFSEEDNHSYHQFGRVGLYCWHNSGARFADIKVIEPYWDRYYTFGEEVPMPASSRVQIFSGNSGDEAKDADLHRANRFVAQFSDPGRVHFPSEGVDPPRGSS